MPIDIRDTPFGPSQAYLNDSPDVGLQSPVLQSIMPAAPGADVAALRAARTSMSGAGGAVGDQPMGGGGAAPIATSGEVAMYGQGGAGGVIAQPKPMTVMGAGGAMPMDARVLASGETVGRSDPRFAAPAAMSGANGPGLQTMQAAGAGFRGGMGDLSRNPMMMGRTPRLRVPNVADHTRAALSGMQAGMQGGIGGAGLQMPGKPDMRDPAPVPLRDGGRASLSMINAEMVPPRPGDPKIRTIKSQTGGIRGRADLEEEQLLASGGRARKRRVGPDGRIPDGENAKYSKGGRVGGKKRRAPITLTQEPTYAGGGRVSALEGERLYAAGGHVTPLQNEVRYAGGGRITVGPNGLLMLDGQVLDRRDPRLWGNAGRNITDYLGQEPNSSAGQPADTRYYYANGQREIGSGDAASTATRWDLRPEIASALNGRVQLHQGGVGGWDEVIDPSKLDYHDELGILTDPSNIKRPDPITDKRDAGVMAVVGGIMGGAALAHSAATGGFGAGAGVGGGDVAPVNIPGDIPLDTSTWSGTPLDTPPDITIPGGGAPAGGGGPGSVPFENGFPADAGGPGINSAGLEPINYEQLPNLPENFQQMQNLPPNVQTPMGGSPSFLSNPANWDRIARLAGGAASLGGGRGGSGSDIPLVSNDVGLIPAGVGQPVGGNPVGGNPVGRGTTGRGGAGSTNPVLDSYLATGGADVATTGAPGGGGVGVAAPAANFAPLPIEQLILDNAMKVGSQGEQDAAAGKAAADIAQRFAMAKKQARGRLVAQGINPDDTRGAGGEMQRLAALDASKASVGAANLARDAEKEKAFAQQTRAAEIAGRSAERNMNFDLGNRRLAQDAGLQMASLTSRASESAADRAARAAEAAASRSWQSGEASAGRNWQSGEAAVGRGWQSGESALNRDLSRAGLNANIAINNRTANQQDAVNRGRGVGSLITGARDIYGLGSSAGWWKDGGRITLADAGLMNGPVTAPKKRRDYRNGARVVGPGSGTSDSIRARLSDGEHVMNAEAVQLLEAEQPGALDHINEQGLKIRAVRKALTAGLESAGLGD